MTHFSEGIPMIKQHITVVLLYVSAKDAESIIMKLTSLKGAREGP